MSLYSWKLKGLVDSSALNCIIFDSHIDLRDLCLAFIFVLNERTPRSKVALPRSGWFDSKKLGTVPLHSCARVLI